MLAATAFNLLGDGDATVFTATATAEETRNAPSSFPGTREW
ncbi:hypothetical protein PI125_g5743 [Phytophthora idaei]|nr:hypothetical protein PI125_g5743 [Phytophthora idaei]